ncbi:MAG TPA: Clp protease N-terminal domain-containing protein [Acidimicrobiales bacterium]|nr:Clp protease N-terminal domain-containing protein [Acidimicrobiales bacterium]
MFERFTDRARASLSYAQDEARELGHDFIGTEHLLLGLLREGDGVAAKALEALGVSLEETRERVAEMIGTGSASDPASSPPFTPRAKKVLELSLREALQIGHNYIGTEHLLLGLVREGDGVAARVLVASGADLTRVRQQVIELLSGGEGTAGRSFQLPRALSRGRRRASLAACSFCGRRAPDTGRLVAGTDAYICEHCVRHWARQLSEGKETGAPPAKPEPSEDQGGAGEAEG